MNRKDQKTFIKRYNSASDAKKEDMVANLFYMWTQDFERKGQRVASGAQLMGVVQSNNVNWKRLVWSLEPFSDGFWFTERAFCEFFYQQIEEINEGLYPKETIDRYIMFMGFDPYKTRNNIGADKTMILPFAKVKKVVRGVAVNANINNLLNGKSKFRGMF